MIRDSGSVKLIWSLGSGTASAQPWPAVLSPPPRGEPPPRPLLLAPFLELRLGLLDLGQAALPPRQLGGDFVAAAIRAVRRILARVTGVGLGQQPGNLLLKPFLFLLHSLVTHRFVPRGI